MSDLPEVRMQRVVPSASIGMVVFAVAAAGCGGAVSSGSAVGAVGRDLSAHAHQVPRGGEACAAKEGLAAQPGGPDKPIGESCAKPMKSDELWRRSMGVLAAYAQTLDVIASEGDGATAGSVQAARTGIGGDDWIEVDPADAPARTAAAQLVAQLQKKEEKEDLEKTIEAAAPHVKVLCDGLVAYLEAQATSFGEIPREMEQKRANRGDRRCTTVDGKSICVSDSASDRVVQAHAFGQLMSLEAAHLDARDAAGGFCAAHAKLAEAAAAGKLEDDATHAAIVEALRSARKPRPAAGAPAAPAAEPPAAKK